MAEALLGICVSLGDGHRWRNLRISNRLFEFSWVKTLSGRVLITPLTDLIGISALVITTTFQLLAFSVSNLFAHSLIVALSRCLCIFFISHCGGRRLSAQGLPENSFSFLLFTNDREMFEASLLIRTVWLYPRGFVGVLLVETRKGFKKHFWDVTRAGIFHVLWNHKSLHVLIHFELVSTRGTFHATSSSGFQVHRRNTNWLATYEQQSGLISIFIYVNNHRVAHERVSKPPE